MTDTAEQIPGFEPGSTVDSYTIVGQIGEGDMARLYLAIDADACRRVFKVPRRTLEDDPVAVVAFENELRLARYLEDFPHAYMPVARSGGEHRYLVMEHIEGTDLWTRLRQEGCIDEAQAIALAKKIVRALAELHRRRIVHLDVKLSNIMVTREGAVRIIDFGLANHLDLPDLIHESFQDPKGTPAYIAPEQFFGVRDEPRSDLYSIGTMLYEMTTSKLPFPDAHSALDVINRIKRAPVSPRHYRPELSDAFSTLILTCLQNLPDRRFASMDALYSALEQIEPAARASLAAAAVATPAPAQTPGMTGGELMARLTSRLWRAVRAADGGNIGEIKAWVAAHHARRTPRYRIVAALDKDNGERTMALNRAILDQAIRQAGLQPSIITVLTVLSDHSVTLAADERERRELNAAYRQTRAAMTALIDGLALDNPPIVIHIRAGDPVAAICGCVADYEADLLVIGARERRALSRFVLGSIAYKVLTTVKCPIFVVQEAAARRARRTSAEVAPAAGVARAPIGAPASKIN